MAWRTTDVREQRVQFVIRASQEQQKLAQLCREFEISRPTGYRWLQRYQQAGVLGIEERSRRPLHCANSTAESIIQQVLTLRQTHPDWGARKLQSLLEQQGISLTIRTVHRILQRQGLIKESSSHRPALQRFERSQPNQLWQMDFKSPKGWNCNIGPLSILDDYSRY